MRVRNINDLILGTIILLLAVFLFHETFFFRAVSSFSFGPRVFPRIILGIIGLCSFIMIMQNLSFGGCDSAGKPVDKMRPDLALLSMRLGMVALLTAYVATLPLTGYLPGTVAFLFLTMLLLGRRTLKAMALYAVVACAVTFMLQYIFGTLLRFFLP